MNRAELVKAIAELIVDKMEIGEEFTNGDFITTFLTKDVWEEEDCPNIIFTTIGGGFVNSFWKDWWNAPYQKDGE